MEHLHLVARFPSIPPESLEEFKAKASEAVGITKDEDGTHRYDWFFNDDETVCVVLETYAGSDSLLSHMGNVGHLLGPLAELGGGVEVDVFGAPSPELMEAAAAFEPNVHNHFDGK